MYFKCRLQNTGHFVHAPNVFISLFLFGCPVILSTV